MTPSNRAYAALAIPAKLRIEPIRRRPPNITCTENAHAMRVDLITNGYIVIVTIDPKRTYIQQRLQRAKIQIDTIQRYN